MEEKKKHKVVIELEVVLLCMIIAILGTNAASSNPPSNGVSYNKNSQTTVEGALNDLYNKANYGNATASQILKGKTALVGGKQVTGTYEAPSLASQTEGNATAENIDEGKIAWVNGKKIVGSRRENLSVRLKLGDYVSYVPSSISYKIANADTGYISDQTINPSELKTWRVIRKNDDGTVDLISKYLSNDKIFFQGEVGYKSYIGTLNKIAKQYENSTYTVGSRHMGYDGTAMENCTGSCSSDLDYQTDESLVRLAIKTLEANTVQSGKTSGGSYWIASRGDSYNGNYELRRCISGGIVSVNMRGSYFSEYIRPIVVLKATLKLTGGNGTESSPYTLGV